MRSLDDITFESFTGLVGRLADIPQRLLAYFVLRVGLDRGGSPFMHGLALQDQAQPMKFSEYVGGVDFTVKTRITPESQGVSGWNIPDDPDGPSELGRAHSFRVTGFPSYLYGINQLGSAMTKEDALPYVVFNGIRPNIGASTLTVEDAKMLPLLEALLALEQFQTPAAQALIEWYNRRFVACRAALGRPVRDQSSGSSVGASRPGSMEVDMVPPGQPEPSQASASAEVEPVEFDPSPRLFTDKDTDPTFAGLEEGHYYFVPTSDRRIEDLAGLDRQAIVLKANELVHGAPLLLATGYVDRRHRVTLTWRLCDGPVLDTLTHLELMGPTKRFVAFVTVAPLQIPTLPVTTGSAEGDELAQANLGVIHAVACIPVVASLLRTSGLRVKGFARPVTVEQDRRRLRAGAYLVVKQVPAQILGSSLTVFCKVTGVGCMSCLEQLEGFPVEGVHTHSGLPSSPAILRNFLEFFPDAVAEAQIDVVAGRS